MTKTMTEETKPPTTTDGVTEQDKGRCAPAPGSDSDVKWLVILPLAIALAFTLRFPMDMIQAISASLLLGMKLGKRFHPNAAGEPQPRKPRT